MTDNIYPFDSTDVSKRDKEELLNQKGVTIWLTGLSGCGKTTIGCLLEKRLLTDGKACTLLDGDNIRSGINSDLNFSLSDRHENIRRVSEINRLFNNAGIITINAFISPTKEIRNAAKSIIGHDNFILIHVSTPIEVCEKRDVKGLYKKARTGEIPDFTGISAPYEVPIDPDFIISTEGQSPESSLDKVYTKLLNSLKFIQ